MATELTAESTHEDITKAVEDIIESRQGDEVKSDAQKIAEERDKPVGDTSAESTSGSDDTVREDEETGTDEQAKWLTDDLKAETAAYGIEEKELADFTSREELERALRFFDRSAMEAGRKAMAEGDKDAGKSRDEKGRFAKKESEEEPEKSVPPGAYEVTLDKNIYDDEIVNEFTRMRDHYESRLAALEERFTQVDIAAEEQQFDGIVDGLGHADLFGKSGSENAKQLQRREDLFVAVKAQLVGMQQLGREADLNEVLVNRVARMVFAEELGKKDLKAQTRKISKQSNSRMGGGVTRPSEPGESLREEMRRRYKELENAG